MAHAPASEKQIAFISKLINDKDTTSSAQAVAIDMVMAAGSHTITKTEASKYIDVLMALPNKNTKTKKQAPAAGYYVYKNEVYKVQVSPSTGNAYAKVFTQEGGWLYAQGMVNKMHDAQPLTLEKAKEFGHLYGSCIICGRTLTDESSIDAGIGPVCAGKL